jgi:hypothetical protein
MSDTNSQAAGNTPTTSSDAQPAATGTTADATTQATAAPAGDAQAANSQQTTEGQTAAASDAAAASSEGDTAAPAGAPEKYEFKAPENVTLDDAVIAEFSTVAKELDLPQDVAQKVIDKLAPKIAQQNAAAIESAMKSASEAWEQATRTDKEVGGEKLDENLAVARKALDRFGTPELRKLLGAFDPKANPSGTGLGNHPEIIKAFLKAGRAISEDRFVPGGQQPPKVDNRNPAKALYPNQPA